MNIFSFFVYPSDFLISCLMFNLWSFLSLNSIAYRRVIYVYQYQVADDLSGRSTSFKSGVFCVFLTHTTPSGPCDLTHFSLKTPRWPLVCWAPTSFGTNTTHSATRYREGLDNLHHFLFGLWDRRCKLSAFLRVHHAHCLVQRKLGSFGSSWPFKCMCAVTTGSLSCSVTDNWTSYSWPANNLLTVSTRCAVAFTLHRLGNL